MKENRVKFYAGCAGGFGFYIAWMILVMLWQTTTPEEAAMKSVIGFALGLVVGVLFYLAVNFGVNKKLEGTISKHKTRYSILGIVAGLAIAFLFGMLFYNPTGVGFSPPFGYRFRWVGQPGNGQCAYQQHPLQAGGCQPRRGHLAGDPK